MLSSVVMGELGELYIRPGDSGKSFILAEGLEHDPPVSFSLPDLQPA
jgi:hypothetical protein